MPRAMSIISINYHVFNHCFPSVNNLFIFGLSLANIDVASLPVDHISKINLLKLNCNRH